MADFSSSLGIHPETLCTLILAYDGYASYLAAGQDGDGQRIAACYLHAAAYEVLLDQEKARTWFAMALEYYVRENNPYGVIAGICCKEITYLGYIDYVERRNTTPDMQFYQLLNLTFIGEPVKTGARQQPVGRLQIPFHLYAETIQATADLSRQQQVAALPEAWSALLTRMHAPVLLLREDSLRWQQLQGTIIPIEPEVIAACITLLAITERNGIPRSNIAALVGKQEDMAFIPMKIALHI